jgi:4a-hydroxytetrahydrobiopterin dehydratase
MAGRSLLSESAVADFLQSHVGWRLEQGELRRTYEFASFKQSVQFVNEVAALAEHEQHHPDIDLHYRHITIRLITFDMDGVTDRDADLAVKIEALKAGFAPT